jgi:hypothetical protein
MNNIGPNQAPSSPSGENSIGDRSSEELSPRLTDPDDVPRDLTSAIE